MPHLTGFVSHAFDDSLYLGGTTAFRQGIEALFRSVEQMLSNNGENMSIAPYFVADEYGRQLPAQLRRKLREADFVVADLTSRSTDGPPDYNENVLFELGFAMSLGLPCLFIRASSEAALPADIRDILVGAYQRPDQFVDCFKEPLAQLIARSMTSTDRSSRTAEGRLTRTWFDPDVSEIHVICAPEPERSRFASKAEPNYLFVDNLEDRDALLEVSTFLARQYPRAKVMRHSSDRVPPDALSGNLVVLGGPGIEPDEGNAITKQLMRHLGSKVTYSGEDDALEYSGKSFHAILSPDESVDNDWGCIMAAPNPLNAHARVVLCHGIYTYGTLGAATALSDYPSAFANHLMLEDAEVLDPGTGAYQFEVIFEVPVVAGGRISPPRFRLDHIHRIDK